MAFKSVFRSLQEVFPQVDLRVLKAVAIEHSKDVDAAVEFILLEVLPSLGGSSEAPYTINDTQDMEQTLANGQSSSTSHDTQEMELSSAKVGANKQVVSLEHQGVEEMNASLLSGLNPVACGSSSDDHRNPAHVEASDVAEAVIKGLHVEYVIDPKDRSFFMPYHEAVKEVNSSLPSGEKAHKDDAFYFESQCLARTMADSSLSDVYGVNSHDQVISNAETEKVCSGEDIFISCPGLADNGHDALHSNVQELYELEVKEAVSAIHTSKNSSSFTEATPYLMEYGAVVEEINTKVSECEEQLIYSNVPIINHGLIGLEANGTISDAFTSAEDMSSSVIEKYPDFMDVGAEVRNNLNNSVTENEELQSVCLVENCSVSSPSETFVFDDSILSSTRSGHVASINFLEDFVDDAKINKKTLASAMEMVTNMMKEVDTLEGRAVQAKEAASTAGQDILVKVEELKQMLKHAQDANNMHAGEVYGERAILATEARELQSRLLSLSNERNKSLSVIEEIRQTLEARRAAAEEEISFAEQEKLEREELARKALHEQEAVMDTVVEESKKLQQEAAENSKLRDFLMDRGRIVDVLQGEIAVICEDVLLLKERVAGRAPLGRSQWSTASTLSSSSSSSSSRKGITPFDSVPPSVELGERPMTINDNQEHPKTRQPESVGDSGKQVYAGGKHKATSDDEWELFDAES